MMISHMTASSTTTTSSSNMNTNSSEPKLAFSIDSIVGRNSSSRSTNDCHSDSDRHSPRVSAPAQHKSRHSPVNCVRSVSPPLMSHRMRERSPHMSRQLSPSNQSAANISPMSTPSPISMSNGSTSSPYLEPSRASHAFGQQSHTTHHPTAMGPSGQLNHQLMMAAAAQHMSQIPQPYHQTVALYPWLFRANPFANRFHGPMAGLIPMDGGHPQFSGAHIHPAAIPAFLSPLFRKPKRIRTAFSPNQLLKLEHAFEKNHYVVGAERKDLARSLNLSETQVKVWFQNRRTKHKRQKDENGEPIDDSEEEEEEEEDHEPRRKDRNNQNSGVNGNSNN